MKSVKPISKEKRDIEEMFNSIAPKYDFLNHLLSFNIDKRWRKRLLKTLDNNPSAIALDLACGTGDISRGLADKGIEVIGMDLSAKMLEIARKKSERYNIRYIHGAADSIPFEEGTFDIVTISFGIRNFDKRKECLDEIYRILKPGGVLAILEFGIPKNRVWRSLYSFYFMRMLPIIGNLISKQNFAYTYLPTSAAEFPQRESFCKELTNGSFKNVSYKPLTRGVAYIYRGTK